ncbi:hypothetical protein D3C81_1823080 [compost metagenome]
MAEYFNLRLLSQMILDKLQILPGCEITKLLLNLVDVGFFTPCVGVQKLHRVIDRHQHFLLTQHFIADLASGKIIGIPLKPPQSVLLQKPDSPLQRLRLSHDPVPDNDRTAFGKHLKRAYQRCGYRLRLKFHAIHWHIRIQLMQN